MYISVGHNIGKIQKLPNGRNQLSGSVDVYIFNGEKHRQEGPAEINNRTGYKAWFKHGVLHRKRLPAVIDPVKKIQEYWEEGKFLRREDLNT